MKNNRAVLAVMMGLSVAAAVRAGSAAAQQQGPDEAFQNFSLADLKAKAAAQTDVPPSAPAPALTARKGADSGGFHVGEEVEYTGSDAKGWVGTIVKLSGDQATVDWGGWGKSSAPLADLKAYAPKPEPKSVDRYGDFKVNEEITCTSHGYEGWEGTILKLYSDGTADIDWGGLGTTTSKLEDLKPRR